MLRSVGVAVWMYWVFSTGCLAQPGPARMDSVEWLVAQSDLIVSGKITSLEKLHGSNEWDRLFLATVKPDDILKGPAQAEVKFVIRSIEPVGRVEQWNKEGMRLLIFLRESRFLASEGTVWRPTDQKTEWKFASQPYAPLHGYDENSILELSPTSAAQSFTMDLRPLTSPSALIEQTKQAVADEPKDNRICCHEFEVDPALLTGLKVDIRRPGDGLGVCVPIDARLEKLAQRWARSDNAFQRHSAVEALIYFKSDENVQILKSMIEDDSTDVSKAAQFALAAWGD